MTLQQPSQPHFNSVPTWHLEHRHLHLHPLPATARLSLANSLPASTRPRLRAEKSISFSRLLPLLFSSKYASGGAVPSVAPPGAAALFHGSPAPITASASGVRAVAAARLWRESVPAAAGRQHGQCLWRIRPVHERSHGPGGGAVWPDGLQARPGICGTECVSIMSLSPSPSPSPSPFIWDGVVSLFLSS